MTELTLDEAKSIQLEVLKEFRVVCEREGLRYSLFAGTLIGAMRHKGYIPWDDDVDVAMPREDYERFFKIFQETPHPEHLKLYDSRVVTGYHCPFIKVADTRTLQLTPGKEILPVKLGLHIDVFPVDGVPRYRWVAKLYLKFMRFLRHCSEMSMLTLGVKGRVWQKKCLIFVFKVLTLWAPPRFWHKLMNRIAVCFPLATSRWGGNVLWGYAEKEIAPVECYRGDQPVSFEGDVFNAFSGADVYLRCVYGDYMTPPPLDKRVANHLVASYRISD